MNVILRERLQEVAQCFTELEVALFSTFTYSSDFFEQNVLPALFGVESSASRAARDAVVHRRLKQTSVGVFYDPSAARSSGKAYRYTHYPVFLEKRLFHPKNIILIGRGQDGKRWLYLAATSANLTLSGWGRNREGFADTWVHAKSEQPWQATAGMLQWLDNKVRILRKGHPLERASQLLQEMQSHRSESSKEDPDGMKHGDKKSIRFYFSPTNTSMWKFLREHYGKLSSVTAASPYWGGCAEIRNALGADLLLDTVVARLPPSLEKTGLGKDASHALYPEGANGHLLTWDDSVGRFSHVKLYEVETAKGTVVGIGSCNFTSRGQFWQAAGNEENGNVESMLFDACAFVWPPTRPLATRDLEERSIGEEAEAPRPWPFYVTVSYDWKKQAYAWQLEGTVGVQPAMLELRAIREAIEVTDGQPAGTRTGELRTPVFQVRHGSETYTGLVTELNLDHSTRTYGTPLGLAAILQSWSNGAFDEPVPPTGEDDEITQEPNPDDPRDEDGCRKRSSGPDGPEFFDFFAFFQATRALRQRLADIACGKSAQSAQVLDLLVARSDSVEALARSAAAARLSPSSEFVVLTECARLLGAYHDVPQAAGARKWVRSRLVPVRSAVLQAIRQELTDRRQLGVANADYPEHMLKWYEHKLNLEFADNG